MNKNLFHNRKERFCCFNSFLTFYFRN